MGGLTLLKLGAGAGMLGLIAYGAIYFAVRNAIKDGLYGKARERQTKFN